MTSDSLSATARVDAPVDRIWALLVDPARHHEIDASGMVGAPETDGAIAGVGQVFTMQMSFARADGSRHAYRTDNHVTVFEPGRAIAWRTAKAGGDQFGWEWRYDLAPVGDGTDVTLTWTYADCDAATRERFGIPGLWSVEAFEASLHGLAQAAASPDA